MCGSNMIHAKTCYAMAFQKHFWDIMVKNWVWVRMQALQTISFCALYHFWHLHIVTTSTTSVVVAAIKTNFFERVCKRRNKGQTFRFGSFVCCCCCLSYPSYIIYKHIWTNLSTNKILTSNWICCVCVWMKNVFLVVSNLWSTGETTYWQAA